VLNGKAKSFLSRRHARTVATQGLLSSEERPFVLTCARNAKQEEYITAKKRGTTEDTEHTEKNFLRKGAFPTNLFSAPLRLCESNVLAFAFAFAFAFAS
jgi:hypothetical protein